MIRLCCSVLNPFKFKGKLFKKRFDLCKNWTLSKNKSFEVQIENFRLQYFFNFDIDLSWNGMDHAGPIIIIEILGVYFAAKFYDHRHWDYETGIWEIYDSQDE